MQINFADHESYHTVPLSTFSTATAELLLSEPRKKFLRYIAKGKSGQGAGKGALSTETKIIYSRLMKQAAIKQKWKEAKQLDATSDTDPLTDVEYDDEPAESDAAGGTPGSSLAAAGASSQKRAAGGTPGNSLAAGTSSQKRGTREITPPPPKKPKQQDYPELIDVLNSFDLPNAQLEFTLEELTESTNMSNAKLKLTDWMLVMCKLSEIQMSSKLDAVADKVEPLKEQLQKLADENKQQQETIDQQKTVISGINALLKESSNV